MRGMRLACQALLRDGQTVTLVDAGRGEEITRQRTELQVPVPTVRDAIGQHTVARVVRRAYGGQPHPPYHPERKKA